MAKHLTITFLQLNNTLHQFLVPNSSVNLNHEPAVRSMSSHKGAREEAGSGDRGELAKPEPLNEVGEPAILVHPTFRASQYQRVASDVYLKAIAMMATAETTATVAI